MTTVAPPPAVPMTAESKSRNRRVPLHLPCDRCSAVGPVHPARPGELLCTACLHVARHHDRSIP